MATIKFLPIGRTDNVNIYLRFSISRKEVYKRKSGFTINPKDWSTTTHLPKQTEEKLKNLKNDLEKLRIHIEGKYNEAIAKKVNVNSEWLQYQIDLYHDKVKKPDEELKREQLVYYTEYFIKELPKQVQKDGTRGVSPRTIQKYEALKGKLSAFEKQSKKIKIKDVGKVFKDEFIEYLEDKESLSENTIGKYITNLKTICLHAKDSGIETHPELSKVIGFREETEIIYLTLEEIEKIKNKKIENEAQNNAKDWLIIGCFIGQRGGDLLKLTKDNLTVKRGIELIELTQEKTKQKVAIPIHHEVKEILDRRNGNFPKPISQQKFNKHIKEVAKEAGLKYKIEGRLLDTDTKRKVKGTYEKWKLVSSHICRRSFASNFYGKQPTSLLIKITGHSTEKQFLQYIGKTDIDFAEQLAEFWVQEQLKSKKEPVLTPIKEAK